MRARGKCSLAITATAALLLLAACGSGTRAAQPAKATPLASASPHAQELFTPVTVRPLGPSPLAVPGTDGRYHVVYELELTNTKAVPATLQRVDIRSAAAPGQSLASYTGQALVGRLRTLAPRPATSAVIEPDTSRLLYVELSFASLGAVPGAVSARLHLRAAANPGATTATPMEYAAGRLTISRAPLPVIGPPLAGNGWVAANGCCTSGIVHRGSVQSINGSLYNSQRFAIDWMRLSSRGEIVHGDQAVPANYPGYGADVLAVAPGTVVKTVNDMPDQTPGKLPSPASFKTAAEVDGNHVILSLGHGLYALYAHLIKGSVTVHAGEHVRRGQVIGRLGNSGNTSAPHLHFQLMSAPSALASEGLPYVIDGFHLAGQIDTAAFESSATLAGVWAHGGNGHPVAETDRFPLNLNIISFPQS